MQGEANAGGRTYFVAVRDKNSLKWIDRTWLVSPFPLATSLCPLARGHVQGKQQDGRGQALVVLRMPVASHPNPFTHSCNWYVFSTYYLPLRSVLGIQW